MTALLAFVAAQLLAFPLTTQAAPAASPPATPQAAAQAPVKRTLKPEDYKIWETLVAPQISNDGKWLMYQINLVDGDGRLVLRNNDGPQIATVPTASQGRFSDDSKWAAYVINPPQAVMDKLREERKPIETKLGLKELNSGAERIFDAHGRFEFAKGSRYLAMLRQRAPEQKEGGTDLTIVNLATGEPTVLGNVTDFDWNEPGDLLAAVIESPSGFSGVQLVDPVSGRIRTLAWGKEKIAALTWARKANVLGYLVGRIDEKKDGPANRILVVRNPNTTPEISAFDPAQQADFPAGYRISENGGLRLSDDGTRVALGVSLWRDKKKPDARPQDKPTVEVWHGKDIQPIPRQKVTLSSDRDRAFPAYWNPGDKVFRVVTTELVEDVRPLGDLAGAVIEDPKPYASAATTGEEFSDVYVYSFATGKRELVLTKSKFGAIPSRKGRYLAYFEGGNWWTYEVATGRRTNLTGKLGVSFIDELEDSGLGAKPPYAPVIWLADDAGLILTDRYDSWLFRPEVGSATCLTAGRKERQRYTLAQIEVKEDGPAITDPMYFRIFDERFKASGYFASDGKGGGKVLALDNANMTALTRAKNTDRVMFVLGTFDKSPNVFITNLQFSAIKPVTNTNPQQANFKWGKAELVQFKSRWGAELQGTLIYPADYDPRMKYPMVTYIYEKLSNGLHSYIVPTDFNGYNAQALSQNGYFVYMPDITYRPRNPGISALDCLEPAVEAVLKRNVGVDSARVGLMGHSWGGYQTAFVTSVSKVFSCGVAGAPLTDLVSMYNSFYWNSGISDQILMENSQGRMEVPFYEDLDAYLRNSPIHRSKERKGPIMIAQGTQDGAVDYTQGQFLYQTLRRMGKDVVFVVYNGENHNWVRKPNQRDYSMRVRHFFDHYLKGAPAEPWLKSGVPYVKQIE